jgi:hypothetical protein
MIFLRHTSLFITHLTQVDLLVLAFRSLALHFLRQARLCQSESAATIATRDTASLLDYLLLPATSQHGNGINPVCPKR